MDVTTGEEENLKTRVRFVTSCDEYRVSDTPFAVPIKLGRIGLSEVINHLLDTTDSQQPFDFLIKDRLLRTSLRKFISINSISTEDVITIEYVPAVSLSDEGKTKELPSWIGCLAIDTNEKVIFSGCYDGQVQVSDIDSLDIVGTTTCHEDSIRSIILYSNSSSSSSCVATSSKDQTIKCWDYDVKAVKKSKKYTLSHIGNLVGHISSVESLCAHRNISTGTDTLLSGDWSGNILGWNTSVIGAKSNGDDDDDDGVSSKNKKKKKKIDSVGNTISTSVSDVKPLFTILRAHAQSVSSICSGSSNTIYSGSWDHSLKQWDIERQDCINTYVGSKVITSIDYSPINNLIASSHPDGRVRVWDGRVNKNNSNDSSNDQNASNSTQNARVFTSSTQWISQVKWHSNNSNYFSSVDYDGLIKIWDLRSTVPVASIEAHNGKALCIDWLFTSDEKASLITGGSDCIIRLSPFLTYQSTR